MLFDQVADFFAEDSSGTEFHNCAFGNDHFILGFRRVSANAFLGGADFKHTKVAKFDMVEDNVQKTSFSCSSVRLGASTKFAVSGTCRARNPICLDPPIPEDWLSRDKSNK